KPFLDADETRVQLASPDAERRRGAAMKLGHQADAAAATVVEAAIARERVERVRHALQEALALIRLAHGAPAVRILAAQSLGDLHSFDAMPALQKLGVDAAASPAERDAAIQAIRQIERWSLLVRTVETVFQGASLASILLLMALGLAIVFALMAGLTLPFNRLFIIALASVSVAGMYWLLFRTDRGLTIRAVTQNRGMSSCLGVRAGVVDAVTFGLGAGLAGLAGAALTQIGNVGPSLGQNYIVDSFMVVVTGGVGKLAGTILAAAGIGGLNKGIEPALG